MRKLLVFAILLVSFAANSQQIQWASKLIKYSSDLGGKQNSIKRILGKPDAFPQGGPSANAWCPKNALDGREVVVVGFDTPQTVKQVAIFENLNAGCVSRIMIDNGSGKFETVWTRKSDYKTPYYKQTIPADRAFYYNRKRRKVQTAPDVSVNMGVEYAILQNAVANAVAVKVEFTFALLPGQKQIDAIGISDSDEPILPIVNTNPLFQTLQDAKQIPLGATGAFNPFFDARKNRLYFSDSDGDVMSIYYSTLQNGSWTQPTKDNNLNTEESYNLLEFLSDEFALKGGLPYSVGTTETGFELMNVSEGKSVRNPLKITAYNNYDTTADATMTSDANLIVIGLESDLSQGGSDLYFATRKADGSYMFLQNMGKSINTAADESMPFLLSDQKTLLFASNGFSCYGDYDIYISHRLDDTWKNWSEPINLGTKINGGTFDGDPCYDEVNQVLYFTKWNGTERAIYSVSLPISMLSKI